MRLMRGWLTLGVFTLSALGCAAQSSPPGSKWAVVIHGGAGVIERASMSKETEAAAIAAMTTSAARASTVMVDLEANACTDITGFGLLGHAYEMAKASDVSLGIDSPNVPLLPDVLDFIAKGMLTRGDKNNRVYVGNNISFADAVSPHMQSALFDPQTAGGLLISISRDKVDRYLDQVAGSVIIGEVFKRDEKLIHVS